MTATATKVRWSPAAARAWMERTARDLCEDAIGRGDPKFLGRDDALQSSAGALYWAVSKGLGCASRRSFIDYLTGPVGWDAAGAEESAREVEEGIV